MKTKPQGDHLRNNDILGGNLLLAICVKNIYLKIHVVTKSSLYIF